MTLLHPFLPSPLYALSLSLYPHFSLHFSPSIPSSTPPFPHQQTEELLKRMSHHPMYQLTWEGAVQALSRNEMNVDSACCAIQCDTLQPLYEYIFSEWNIVKQQDMEEMKGLIKKEAINKDVRTESWGDCFLLIFLQQFASKAFPLTLVASFPGLPPSSFSLLAVWKNGRRRSGIFYHMNDITV